MTDWCHEYIKDYNAHAAAIRAGASKTRARTQAHTWVKRYSRYLQDLQKQKTAAVAKKVVYDQNTILKVMARAAFANPQEFYCQVKVKGSDGKMKTVERLKPIMELTAEQASVITNVRESRGRVVYDLMDAQENRRLLGMNQGLFHQKLIAEHRHAHLHAAIDLTKVDDDKLAHLEKELVQLLGPQAARLLGQTTEDESARLVENAVIEGESSG